MPWKILTRQTILITAALWALLGILLVNNIVIGDAKVEGEAVVFFSQNVANAQGTDRPLVANCKAQEDLELHLQVKQQAQIALNQKDVTSNYQPAQRIAIAHSTNYGDRFQRDVKGRSVNNQPLVVLHETVGSANGTLGLFQTPHPRDEDQVSYHTLVTEDGTLVYIVPPDKRAFGAGNSVFKGTKDAEAVQTNPKFPASVNNFAYHISLETPASGIHYGRSHKGYTDRQYQSLAWLVAKTGVADERITTHRDVDRSRSRIDPRSFNQRKFMKLLNSYPRQDEIGLTCGIQPLELQTEEHIVPSFKTLGNGLGQ